MIEPISWQDLNTRMMRVPLSEATMEVSYIIIEKLNEVINQLNQTKTPNKTINMNGVEGDDKQNNGMRSV